MKLSEKLEVTIEPDKLCRFLNNTINGKYISEQYPLYTLPTSERIQPLNIKNTKQMMGSVIEFCSLIFDYFYINDYICSVSKGERSIFEIPQFDIPDKMESKTIYKTGFVGGDIVVYSHKKIAQNMFTIKTNSDDLNGVVEDFNKYITKESVKEILDKIFSPEFIVDLHSIFVLFDKHTDSDKKSNGDLKFYIVYNKKEIFL